MHPELVRWGAEACQLPSSQHVNFSPTGPGPGSQGRRALLFSFARAHGISHGHLPKEKNSRTSVGQVSGALEEALCSDRHRLLLKTACGKETFSV